MLLAPHETAWTQSADHRRRLFIGAPGHGLVARPSGGATTGMGRSDEFTVEGVLVTDVGGTIGASVPSTPRG